MKKSSSKNESITCPIEKTLSVIGNKWTMLIIRDLLKKTMRFSELQRSLVGISPRTLSLRMTQLEENGIVKKKIYPVVPPKTEYSLTPKGQSLASILGQMIEWGDNYA